MSDTSQGPGWWQASDGKWYPPEQTPGAEPTAAPTAPPAGYGQQPPGAVPYGGTVAPGVSPGQLADWPQRVVAFLIDYGIVLAFVIVVFIVGLILGAIADVLGILVFVVGYAIAFVAAYYFHYLNGVTGQSPGKALTGLKTISASTGETIGGGAGVIRGIAHILDGFLCGLGYLWPLWDEKRQTFADKVMSTVVVTGQPKRDFGPEIFKAP